MGGGAVGINIVTVDGGDANRITGGVTVGMDIGAGIGGGGTDVTPGIGVLVLILSLV